MAANTIHSSGAPTVRTLTSTKRPDRTVGDIIVLVYCSFTAQPDAASSVCHSLRGASDGVDGVCRHLRGPFMHAVNMSISPSLLATTSLSSLSFLPMIAYLVSGFLEQPTLLPTLLPCFSKLFLSFSLLTCSCLTLPLILPLCPFSRFHVLALPWPLAISTFPCTRLFCCAIVFTLADFSAFLYCFS